MQYTDTQLKKALAKMLPKRLYWGQVTDCLEWKDKDREDYPVDDTELLHLCWLVEETLMQTLKQEADYIYLIDVSDINNPIHATWQQRVIALCKVKGVEIV